MISRHYLCCIRMVLFIFILLRVYWTSWICKSVFSSNWEISAFISSKNFSAVFNSILLLKFLLHMLHHFLFSHRSLKICSFFPNLFPPLSQSNNYYYSVFGLTGLNIQDDAFTWLVVDAGCQLEAWLELSNTPTCGLSM